MQNFQIALMSNGSPLGVELPDFFVDYTRRPKDYIEVKRSLIDMYNEYIQSENYKSREWDGEYAPLIFMYLNELLDNMFLAHQSTPDTNVTIAHN